MSDYPLSGLQPGQDYVIRMHFAEIFWRSAGSRIFNVAANDRVVLSNVDIVAQAGGPRRALTKEFTATADASGRIQLGFSAVRDQPAMSGIEILTAAGS